MRRFPLRRAVGALLALAIVAGAPGSEAYHAAAQTVGGRAAESGSFVRPVSVLGAGLSSPIPALTPSVLSVSPSLMSAPVVAPAALAAPIPALAVPVRAAAQVSAVPMGPAHVVKSQSPLANAAKTGPPSVVSPSALARSLTAAASVEKTDAAANLFDGAAAKTDAVAPVVASARRGLGRAFFAALVVTVGMLGIQAPQARGQTPPQQSSIVQTVKQAPPAAVAPQASAPADSAARAVLPRPVEASVAVDLQGVTIGERIHLTITLRNTSDKPVTLQNLRSSLQDALPEDLELQGKGAEAPLTLAPGESKTITYEAIPFGSGTLTLDGGIAVVPVGETAVYPEGIEIVLPKTAIAVKTVLTPDWKEKGLKDIIGVKRAAGPDWMWLAAIPLGILLFVGVRHLVETRRLYPKLDDKRLSLVAVTETELARLRSESGDLDAASFYARYQDLVTGFMVDFAGLPKTARDARTFERDLRKSFYDAGQVSVAARLAAEAEAARFAGSDADQSERARMADRLQALIGSVAGKAGKPKTGTATGALGVLALLPGAAGLSFGSPWVLLLLIPLAAYIAWSWRARAKGERFAVSSAAQMNVKRTLRERLVGLPRILRLAAVGLIIVALARPMIGTQRTETFIPSTDTVVAIDLSGSMSGAKLDGVRDAVRGYVEEQRRGTENRVGMVTFSDQTYLDVKLTTDYDALISHLKELETTGSTAVGKAMLTSIAHFLELNALELDGKADPRAAEVQRLLKDQGLSAALAYAKQHPDLLKTILQPERAKIVVLFTDGDSNTGIDPQEAAAIAASLGVKIYGVGIAGPNESFNEATLRGVAEKTGAKFYRAGDANAMRAVLLEIAKLEKSPAKIVSSISVKDYTSLLAMLAFLLLGAELTLANTRLRTLYGLAFVIAFNGAPMSALLPPGPASQTVIAQVETSRLATATQEVPAEVLEGNKLYHQGRFAEALKKYGEAVERHPDVAEIYFNMADAYLRLGENAKADAAWAKYLSLTPDAKKQSQTLFNLGNSALQAKDPAKAIELYKEALRRDAGNQEAKWNLEALKQAQKEQQKDSKDSKKGKPGKQKGKPGEGKPGDGNPSDSQPGDGKPSDGKPGDGKPSDGKAGGGKPQAKPGDPKEGADKLGQALGEQEKGEKGEALKGMTRKGSGVWGMAALPLAFAGHGIVFSSSMFLWFVGIGLPVVALLVAWGLKKRLDAARLLSPGTAPKTFRTWWGARRYFTKTALMLAALGAIGLAGGDPRGGMVDERVNFGGKDIVVTVDGSYSMTYAEDGRMARTQKELNEFITRLQGTDRVGLVVFAGKSRTASPISIDYGNFEFKINRLDVESRGISEGSDLAGAIKYAAAHFETAKKLGDRQRILILISDGDVPEAQISAAIAAAAEHGVTVYAIGVGDPAGTKIKMPTEDGKGTEYLIDAKTGAPAVTRLNEAPLRLLAERTGGAYFRSGGKASIDEILNEVSRLEKGHKGDVIRSPSPVGVYLLWPALLMLLLDLVLPGRSLLRRDAPAAKPEDKSKKTGPGGAALLGAALIPLGAWPQILPFAAIATLIAGYLAADSWSGGAITRRAREWWQSRRGFIEKGVAADLIHLYDLREADESRLSAFVKTWQGAKEPLREKMIPEAAGDEALWREKLTAVYLSGAAPETLEKILTALRRTARSRLEPLSPVAERMAARRGQISWMAHSDAEARLASLKSVAAAQPAAFEAPKAPAPSGLLARLKRGATIGVLAVMIVLTGASSIGTLSFREEQRAAAEISMKLFYSEDLFVFSDRYVDERITREVLPALQRWHDSPQAAGADFERALTILRESPDPKADNILVMIFRHAGVLPLTNQAENTMLRALIERESDALWVSMDALISQSRTDPSSAKFLVKLVMLGVESGNEKAITQIFRVLKSPNAEVQQQAAKMLYANLTQKDGAFFLGRLTAVQAKHAADPTLQLWTASFLFRRLGEPGLSDADLLSAQTFIINALANADQIDAARLAIYKQTPPGQDVQAPASLKARLVALADRMEGDGDAPAALAGAARFLVTKAALDLIREGEKMIPGLHARLLKDGVVLPDNVNTYNNYRGDYEDYDHRGYGPGFGRGGDTTTVTPSYREVYKLSHLKALLVAIDEVGSPLAQGADKAAPAVREFLDRAESTLEPMLSAGAKAGMLEGGSAAEAAADGLLLVLREGASVFSSQSFLQLLRGAGLAPLIGDMSSQLAYPEALDAAQLARLRELLVATAASGKSWDYSGKPRPMTWDERVYLARAVYAVEASLRKNFPDSAKAVPADAEKALLEALARPGEESLIMPRLALALDANAKDVKFALRMEKLALARLAASPADAEFASAVFTRIFPTVMGTKSEAEALAAISSALKGPAGAELAKIVRKQSDLSLLALASQAEKAFPALKEELVNGGLKENATSWRPEFKLRHYQALLAAAEEAAAKTRAGGKSLTAEQSASLESLRSSVPRLKALGAQAGIPTGDDSGEISADLVNPRLEAAYSLFPGQTFRQALQAAGLTDPNPDNRSGYRTTYTKAQLIALRDWLKVYLVKGTVEESNSYYEREETDGTIRPLNDAEKEKIRAAIAAAERAIAGFKEPAAPAGKLHGFAPLALAALPGFAPWVIFAALGLGAAYLLWRLFKMGAGEAAVEPARESISGAVLARHRRIELSARRMATAVNGGSFRSRFIGGGGTDYAEARPYQGEDLREVDWKTSAKKDELYAKKFELERDMPLMLVIDISRSSRFGTRGTDKRAVIEDAAAVLALAAAHSNVRVGAVLVSDRVEQVIPARGGSRHAMTIIDAILKAEPTGSATDLKPGLEAASRLLGSRAMVAVLSDFIAPDFKDALGAIAARHDVRAIRVTDPAELGPLPDVGLLPVVDAETGAIRMLDTSSRAGRAEAAAAISRREAAVETAFAASRLNPISISTEGDPLESLEQAFHPKAKQAFKP